MMSTAVAAATVVSSALFFAAAAGANPTDPDDAVAPISGEALPGAPDALPDADAPDALPDVDAPDALPASEAPADAVVVAHIDGAHHLLSAGVCNERGLQVKTIEVERAVSEAFPQIHTMVGVRPDPKPWHPNGLAVDIMIPNAGSSEGIALGNAIRDYALNNVGVFGIQDVIWRGTYYTPAGPSGSGYGHYDHVHITTTGGGYPHGDEEYVEP